MVDRLGKPGRSRSEDLALIVSEHVTNAVVHGRGDDLELRMTGTRELIRIEVSDHGTEPFDWPGPDNDGHRGLALVKRFSERCGAECQPRTLVWCELALAATG
jgi:anti-sigma regulatory factor (Ser/Thr protein kinase)